MNYKVIVDKGSVHIVSGTDNHDAFIDYLDAFIDIYTEDGDIKSPFKNTDDAKTFAEVILKVLEQIT